ncbi:MAG: hypothetical protein F9K18_08985, partial [Thermoanaerobaculia bacterium]
PRARELGLQTSICGQAPSVHPSYAELLVRAGIDAISVNIDAVEVRDGAAARSALERQVDGPVRWVECVQRLATALGVTRFVEVGPGSVLAGLVRRIVPGAEAFSLAEPDALARLAAS